jgi:ribonuclease D
VGEYEFITQPRDLTEAVAQCLEAPLVAVDTEAASFHRYVDRIYLIQLAVDGRSLLLDPLALTDLSPLGQLLADPRVEKVLHDADYDLRILDRDYAFRARRVFDTRIAAHLAGEPAVGLASLVEKYCGVKLAKTHQKADWSARPLSAAMLAYAAADTRHLPALRAALLERLTSLSRRAWAEEEFARLESLRWTGGGDAAEAYLRMKGAKALRPRQLAALRELHAWREGTAAAEDKAPFRVIGNEALLGVARAMPDSEAALAKVPRAELPPRLARRHADALLAAVARARELAESELPVLERTRRPPRDPALEGRLERLKAARNTAAKALGLDPGVLCGRNTREAVAKAAPTTEDELGRIGELRRWQITVLGGALLAAIG